MEETKIFTTGEIDDAKALYTIKEVASILEERGYNPVNQIVGYLMCGDPGYITSYKNARTKLTEYDKSKLIEILLKNSL